MRFILLLISISIYGCASNTQPENTATTNQVEASAEVKTSSIEQAETTQLSTYNKRYQDLVKKVKSAPSFEYVKALKLTYIRTDYYQPFLGTEAELIASIYNNIESKNWIKCNELSDQILTTNYISLDAHYGAMVCSFETNLPEQGKYHRTVMTHLLQAMWQSGDGLSPLSPLFCTSKPELDAFLKFSGFSLLKQSLLDFEGKTYDVVMVKDPDSDKEFELFFDISSQWQYGFKDIE